MQKIPAMVDMKRTPDEVADTAMPDMPMYPYGLCISLCQEELDKLGLTSDDVEVGDMVHLHCLAKVTSVSQSDHEAMGKSSRVELQITHMTGESEDAENRAADMPVSERRKRLYGG